MGSQYIFDDDDFRVRRRRRSIKGVLLTVLKYFIASVSLAVLYYFIFSIFFSTETERRLKTENRMYERVYSDMEEDRQLLEDVVSGLRSKDNQIYNELFHTDVVSLDGDYSGDFLVRSDSLRVGDIVSYSEKRLESLLVLSDKVEADFADIFRMLSSGQCVMPPLHLPIDGFLPSSVGATVGNRINPFYKVKVRHDGLDMVAPSGTPVRASADGVIADVVRSRKGLGNVVEIEHKGGYRTKYAHLSEIKALRGRPVRQGDVIGKVGVTGKSFAPHLHYEVWKDSVALDPVSFFFGDVTPEEYGTMMLLAASAGQSMD